MSKYIGAFDIILIAWFCFLFFKGIVLFPWWVFLIIFGVEVMFYALAEVAKEIVKK